VILEVVQSTEFEVYEIETNHFVFKLFIVTKFFSLVAAACQDGVEEEDG